MNLFLVGYLKVLYKMYTLLGGFLLLQLNGEIYRLQLSFSYQILGYVRAQGHEITKKNSFKKFNKYKNDNNQTYILPKRMRDKQSCSTGQDATYPRNLTLIR